MRRALHATFANLTMGTNLSMNPLLSTDRTFVLDKLDHALLAMLRADPRQTNRALAQQLSVSESTIAARISALETNGVMKIMAQRDFSASGYFVLAQVDVNVTGRPVAAVAEELALIDGVGNLMTFLGDPAIMLLAMAGSLPELQLLVMDQIACVNGVRSVETMVYAGIVKYESEFANFTTFD